MNQLYVLVIYVSLAAMCMKYFIQVSVIGSTPARINFAHN